LIAAMAVLAVVLLLATAGSAVHDLRMSTEQQALESVSSHSHSYARELRARLAASELVVQTLVADGAGAGGGLLRSRILRSEIIHGVVISGSGRDGGPVPLSNADRLALSAGHTLLVSGTRRQGESPQYLVHAVRAAGTIATAFFELSPDWLWQGRDE